MRFPLVICCWTTSYISCFNCLGLSSHFFFCGIVMYWIFVFSILQYMTDGVLMRETLKDSELDKYRYELHILVPKIGPSSVFYLLSLHYHCLTCNWNGFWWSKLLLLQCCCDGWSTWEITQHGCALWNTEESGCSASWFQAHCDICNFKCTKILKLLWKVNIVVFF